MQHVKDIPSDDRKAYSVQIAHISADLKEVMTRREQGLDEDWSEDALSADEEVTAPTTHHAPPTTHHAPPTTHPAPPTTHPAPPTTHPAPPPPSQVEEDRELLAQMDIAISSIVAAKGVHPEQVRKATLDGNVGEGDAEGVAKREKSAELLLKLLGDESEEPREEWHEGSKHEGCLLFGFVDVSRAPGTLHISPHSTRHSFDFQAINTSHHIDHLSFGLELPTKERGLLPPNVVGKLAALDDAVFLTHAAHETQEHHINVMPTSYATHRHPIPIETFQFTSTSHSRTKETLPSLIISYDVSPIMVRIKEAAPPLSDFIVSLCAIVGGAFAIFGILDGFIYTSQNAVKSRIGKLS